MTSPGTGPVEEAVRTASEGLRLRIVVHEALPTALLGTGFLGGYTTFSTDALEGLLLYTEGSRRLAVASLLGPVLAGLLAAAAGAGVARLGDGG